MAAGVSVVAAAAAAAATDVSATELASANGETALGVNLAAAAISDADVAATKAGEYSPHEQRLAYLIEEVSSRMQLVLTDMVTSLHALGFAPTRTGTGSALVADGRDDRPATAAANTEPTEHGRSSHVLSQPAVDAVEPVGDFPETASKTIFYRSAAVIRSGERNSLVAFLCRLIHDLVIRMPLHTTLAQVVDELCSRAAERVRNVAKDFAELKGTDKINVDNVGRIVKAVVS